MKLKKIGRPVVSNADKNKKRRAYYKLNAEHIRAEKRRSYYKNREVILQRQAIKYWANPAPHSKYNQLYYLKNKERLLAKAKVRRDAKP